jgi:phosphopantothenoylcysteine decarboxylase/phosphopantothenate--cysteine ligase
MPSEAFASREIVVGVSGGIAAYKAAALTSRLRQSGAAVTVVMTVAATRFVQPLTFAVLTQRPVIIDLFERPESYRTEHIALAEKAELAIVAPATANLIGKVAAGIADDALTTILISLGCPVVIAPAMNHRMWANPVVQANTESLRTRGYHIVEPEEGWLACGERGAGRLAEADAILAKAEALLP